MDVLMAAHGAGCTFVLFMRERSVFIEIQAKTWWSIMAYFELSRIAALVHVFTAVPGVMIGSKNTPRFPLDLCDQLARVIDGILEHTALLSRT
jgi:hypothetical protein